MDDAFAFTDCSELGINVDPINVITGDPYIENLDVSLHQPGCHLWITAGTRFSFLKLASELGGLIQQPFTLEY